jgi:hypothetical protein
MKNNRSLAISAEISSLQKNNLLTVLSNHIPSEIYTNDSTENRRDRVFSSAATIETMLLTATQEDKSLKNSVLLFYASHQKKRELLQQELDELKKQEQSEGTKSLNRKAGRPRKHERKIPRSKQKDISLNTSAYSKARKRLPVELTEKLFSHSKLQNVRNKYSHFHGLRVFEADGTYLQLQDTAEIKEDFPIKDKRSGAYPQALLTAIIERGTGQVFQYVLSSRLVSELQSFNAIQSNLPKKSVILFDALYNCYETLSQCFMDSVDFVVPSKNPRNYKVIESYSATDQIIEIKAPKRRSRWADKDKETIPSITLRRIECYSPDGKKYVLFTSLTDKAISKDEIQILYLTRWDIEISIREIKTIMDINILRSKTPEMLKKELNVSLAAYNLIRTIIYESIKDFPFSPERDFIYELYSHHKKLFIDKKGRVYKRWSSGRRRAKRINKETDSAEEKAQ